jgi:putative membrane protein
VSVLVTLADGVVFGLELHMDVAVFGMLGTMLAIILGFRTNASYDRYREGRLLWGDLVAGIRSFTRALSGYLPDARFEAPGPEGRIVRSLVALPHLLRHELRGTDPVADVAPWLERDLTDRLLATRFPTASLLEQISRDLHDMARADRLSELARVALEQELAFLQRQINGCDRLQTTPIPFAYSLLVHRTISVYLLLLPFGVIDSAGGMTPIVCFMLAYTFFGLEAVGTQIEDPFGTQPNDLPLAALCRGVEIDLAPLLGQAPPAPLAPVNGVLL